MPLLQLVRHAESANNALYNEIISECGGAAAVASDPSLQRRVDEEEARRRSSDPPLSARGLEQAARPTTKRFCVSVVSGRSGEDARRRGEEGPKDELR